MGEEKAGGRKHDRVAVALNQPLFYSFDVDEDGTWDIMYKDIPEDSVNGNEVFYESPSGMFTNGFNNF